MRFTLIAIVLILSYNCLSKEHKNVTGIGFAMEYSKALKRAKRDALENSIGVFLSSKTIIENYTMIEDKIISKTDGMVKKYKITSEETMKDGTRKIEIKAEVTDVIEEFVKDDNAIEFLLREMNLPNFAVIMVDEEYKRDRLAESLIKKYLKKKGFRLKHVRVTEPDDIETLAKQNIDYLFRGSSEYEFMAISSYGIKNMKTLQLNIESELIDCKTKDIVSTSVINQKSAHISEKTAKKLTLDKACPEIATLLVEESVASWSKRNSRGLNRFSIIIENIEVNRGVDLFTKLTKKFAGEEEVYDKGFVNNKQSFELSTLLSENDLMKLLKKLDSKLKLKRKNNRELIFEM